jgi:SRSO17 transposase
VQRQYLGCVGKVGNGIVTVHVGLSKGRLQALLDAELYLPESWDADRARCRAAGIPDAVRYRPKWRIARDQLIRLGGNGLAFDWLTFDEGYGAAVPFLDVLNEVGQRFVAEVPVHFTVRDTDGGPPRRADERLRASAARGGRRYRLSRRTVRDAVWRAAAAAVRAHVLVVAVNEATAQVKYFLTNATAEPLARVLAVAFRRWTVEQGFRLGKQEAGLLHYEGRDYTGLIRHLTLALVVLGFVAAHTERLRGEKPPGDGGASVPGAQPTVRGPAEAAAGRARVATRERGHPVSPAAQRAGDEIPQEEAA